MSHVTIIGGGIAGLATAYYLEREAERRGCVLRCVVLERDHRLGGKIVTVRRDGFVLEGGPDSIITQKPAGLQLVSELGLDDQKVPISRTSKTVYIRRADKLLALPAGFRLAVPTQFMPFIRTRTVSPFAKVRMAMDLIIPARQNDGDESVADFIRRRLGHEALERLAGPMMSGIYVADPETLSMRATFPMFVEMEKKYRSLTRGMWAAKRMARKRSAEPPPMFVTLKGGMNELVNALEAQLDCELRCAAPVSTIRRTASGFVIDTDGTELATDAVVLATPAATSAALVDNVSPELAARLRSIRALSSATVSLAFRRHDLPPAFRFNGLGFIVPKVEPGALIACTFTSNKFAHRAPDDTILLRAFVGGAGREAAAETSPTELVATVRNELSALLGITAEPVIEQVFKWTHANPQYDVGHLEKVAEIERLVGAVPGLHITGSSYRGIGVPDCINAAKKTATRVIDQLECMSTR